MSLAQVRVACALVDQAGSSGVCRRVDLGIAEEVQQAHVCAWGLPSFLT